MRFSIIRPAFLQNRNPCVDIFRAVAIISVVVWHFDNSLPFGYLGVDLFFVISGLLVGSILIKAFKAGNRIHFFEFILRRGLKIWPSYFVFLLAGSLLAWAIFRHDNNGYTLEGGRYLWRYIFFFQNYQGLPFNWPFAHIWSLCVEEHFYILLPIIVLVIQAVWGKRADLLIASVLCLIAAGILMKIISYTGTPGIAVYTTTHKNIDALGWGVLLGIITVYKENQLKQLTWLPLISVFGLVLLATCILLSYYETGYWFQKVAFSSLVPVSFFAMILGLYFKKTTGWKPLRVLAYYSYNWYLWHPLMAVIAGKYLGYSAPALLLYLLISFLAAVFFTIAVEEPFLLWRDRLNNRLFKSRTH